MTRTVAPFQNNTAGRLDIATACIARQLGCKSIELIDPKFFPILKKHGLVCAIGQIDMSPDPPFLKGMNNPKYHDQVVAAVQPAWCPVHRLPSNNGNDKSGEQGKAETARGTASSPGANLLTPCQRQARSADGPSADVACGRRVSPPCGKSRHQWDDEVSLYMGNVARL